MTDNSEAKAGLVDDQERSTARTEAPRDALLRAEAVLDDLATKGPKAGRADYGGFVSSADAALLYAEITRLRHDAINRHILIEARARRLGVFGMCPACDGDGSVRVGSDRIALYLWVLHPRKGCGRGWTIRDVSPDDLPEVRAFLAAQFEHHRTTRFAWALA